MNRKKKQRYERCLRNNKKLMKKDPFGAALMSCAEYAGSHKSMTSISRKRAIFVIKIDPNEENIFSFKDLLRRVYRSRKRILKENTEVLFKFTLKNPQA